MRKILCFEYIDYEYELHQIFIQVDKELSSEQQFKLYNLILDHCEENEVDVDDGYIYEVCSSYFEDIGVKWSGAKPDYKIVFN